MRIDGQWLICDDGAVRPVVRGEVQGANGAWLTVEFLVDTGADRTALSADVFAKLGLSPLGAPGRLTGIGGSAASVEVETFLRLFTDEASALFRERRAAFTELEALDMSVLGRDVMGLFAVIVDRPREVVCLLGQGHDYDVVKR